jgi:PRTRC genetic system ThiF family protein
MLQTATLVKSGLSYVEARPVLLRQAGQIEFVQVGAGGTGSWVTPHLVRLARELMGQGRKVTLTIIDPDTVSAANTVRQNFVICEVGQSKAKTLALRYSAAWGIEIAAIAQPFDASLFSTQPYQWGHERLVMVVSCVDNAAARREISKVLSYNPKISPDSGITKTQPPRFWVCDAGNYRDGGQVLLGSTSNPAVLRSNFEADQPNVCFHLPSPYLQHPELLEPLPEETADHSMTCAELLAANAQSLTINVAMAAQVADTLTRLFTGGLKRFATYLYLPTGTMRSRYTNLAELQTFWDTVAAAKPQGEGQSEEKDGEREEGGNNAV